MSDDLISVQLVSELAALELPEAIACLGRLVAEPSIEGSPAIANCLDIVADSLARIPCVVSRPVYDGLEALLARFGDPTGHPALVLAGHVDVVPCTPGWSTPPFTLSTRHGRLAGRGVTDMKGGVVAFLSALRILHRVEALDKTSLLLVLTGDEEVGSERGMIPLVGEGLVQGAAAICGEPTDLDVFVGNRGLVWIEIDVRGRGGHAGYADELANPIPVAADLVRALHAMKLPERDTRFEPPVPSLNVTMLDAGAAERSINTIPDVATIGLDRRLLPGSDPEAVIAALQATVNEVVGPPFSAELRVRRRWPPYVLEVDHPFVGTCAAAVRAMERPGRLGADQASDDSSWLGAAGIPTVLIGPGEPAQAHATDESLAPADLRDAIATYVLVGLAAIDS